MTHNPKQKKMQFNPIEKQYNINSGVHTTSLMEDIPYWCPTSVALNKLRNACQEVSHMAFQFSQLFEQY